MDHLGDWFNWPFGPEKTASVDLQLNVQEFLEFYSEDHTREGNGWSGGGEFRSKKNFVRYNPSGSMKIAPGGNPMYTGSVYAIAPTPAVFHKPILDLFNFGPSVYRQANPDKAIMDVGNAIYELKDVPGMLKAAFEVELSATNLAISRKKYAKADFYPDSLSKVSDFNLAVAFGWLPLLSDCISLYQGQKKLAKTIAQLKRDNGRPIRRRFEVKDQTQDSSEILASGSDPYGTNLSPNFITRVYGDGHWELSRHETTRMWFSGQFRSWLPEQGQMSDDQWTSMIRNRLFGLSPTPSRIYKAMPWSWLIDWFSNVGDNLANLNTNVADRQINDYAFLMRHSETFNRLSVLQRFHTEGDNVVEARAITESGTSLKERTQASPFGFGIKIPDLSPFQLTILGSLGGKSGKALGFT